MKFISIFVVFVILSNSCISQLNPHRPTLGTRNLGGNFSTTNSGGIGAFIANEASFSLFADQRFNYQISEKTAISLGIGLELSTATKLQFMSDKSPERSLGSFGYMIPLHFDFNWGCQSFVNNLDAFGLYTGFGYAIAGLPKYNNGVYTNSGSIGYYTNVGTLFALSEKFKMGLKLYAILNQIPSSNLTSVYGLQFVFYSNPKY